MPFSSTNYREPTLQPALDCDAMRAAARSACRELDDAACWMRTRAHSDLARAGLMDAPVEPGFETGNIIALRVA